MLYQGSCHCGALQFEVEAPEDLALQECNCSMCSKVGYLHLIVPKAKFKLLAGQENITTYTFNTGVAQHTFCKICGVKPFYTPRSNPSGVSVNYRCLSTPPRSVKVEQFDGQNWEAHAAGLAHLSPLEEP
jgi:hypothetical protein